jgi:hypothetical protein
MALLILVAHVRVAAIDHGSDFITYKVGFLEQYKPKSGGNFTGSLLTAVDTCQASLLVGQDYLIAAKREGSNLSLNRCETFPNKPFGLPVAIGGLPWDQVDANLEKKLKTGTF